jgi:hypothetical protein
MPAVPDDACSYTTLINNYLKVCHNKGLNILGMSAASLKPNNATAVKASFPPTSLALQVYPYKANPSDDAKAGLDEDNNCLVYKQMTQHHDLPQDLAYPYGGNLVDPGQNGTLMISRSTFWDDWLLPILTTMNQSTLVYNVKASCRDDEVNPDWNYSFKFGTECVSKDKGPDGKDQPLPPSFFAFTAKPSTATSRGFTWHQGDENIKNQGVLASKLMARITSRLCDVLPSPIYTV